MVVKMILSLRKRMETGHPWWRSGEESTCQYTGHKFDPWSGKTPYATEQLSLCATAPELPSSHQAHPLQPLKPTRREPALRKRGRCRERPTHGSKSSSHALHRERACRAMKTRTAKHKLIFFQKRMKAQIEIQEILNKDLEKLKNKQRQTITR